MIKYIIQFARPTDGAEYIVMLDEKPTPKVIKNWCEKGFAIVASYCAEIDSLHPGTTPNALPTESKLEVQ